MKNNEVLVTGLAIAYFIFQTVFYLLRKKNNDEARKLNDEAKKENRELIEKLHGTISEQNKQIALIDETTKATFSMHNVKDQDGIPIWYVPRSWKLIQENIMEICREILNVEKQQIELIKMFKDGQTN
jgi:hypothetical protein